MLKLWCQQCLITLRVGSYNTVVGFWFLFFFCREIQAGAKLSLNRQFFDERWSKHRVVSCLDWSSQVNYNNKIGLYLPIFELQ